MFHQSLEYYYLSYPDSSHYHIGVEELRKAMIKRERVLFFKQLNNCQLPIHTTSLTNNLRESEGSLICSKFIEVDGDAKT